MFKDLYVAFANQFTRWNYRAIVISLMVVMAAVPVGELLIFRQFAQVLVQGAGDGGQHTWQVLSLLLLFFVGFASIRALSHFTKFWRVRIFRRAFDGYQEEAGLGAASWRWSQAFSVSNVIADLIQVAAVLALLLWFDLTIGGAMAGMFALVMMVIAVLYRRQIRVQREFIADTNRRVETGIRERIFSAEVAGIVASVAMGLSLALIAWRTITGETEIATAIVLGMGSKMFFGRVGGLAPTFMRFARDSLRLERDLGNRQRSAFDDDENGDMDVRDAPRPSSSTVTATDAEAPPRRPGVTGQLMIAAQRADRALYEKLLKRMGSPAEWSEGDHAAVRGAEAFYKYARGAGSSDAPIRMFWRPRPLPGLFDEWAPPFIVHAATHRRIDFVPLLGDRQPPSHILTGGNLADHAAPNSVVVGAGVSKREIELPSEADFISLRGPMTARIVSRSGGPIIESFGDARLLMRRVHKIDRREPNGKLAFIRHPMDARIAFNLPEDMEEVSFFASKPDEMTGMVDALAQFDGVVTSSLGVLAICHSYGLPSALAVHERSSRIVGLDFALRDHLLGAGMDGDWQLHRMTSAVGRIDWRDRLVTESVESAKLSEIGDAVTLAILRHTEAQHDALEREMTVDDGRHE